MRKRPAQLLRDENGATMVETAIVATMFFMVTFGLVEFALALWQWNSASKATQLGARIAAVSDPVWQQLVSPTVTGPVDPTKPGPDYDVTCDGSSGTCFATPGEGGGSAGAATTFDPAAFDTIVMGRDSACKALGPDGFPGMCDIFFQVEPENVVVRYYNSGLGFSGRPGGPVPTITVSVTGLQYQFVVLDALLGLGPITMPDFTVTMTGEDLCVSSPAGC